MTITEANKKILRCLNFASFIHESAEAVACNESAINVDLFSYGLSAIAKQMTDDLAQVHDRLRQEEKAGGEAAHG